MRILIVTAVEGERNAIQKGIGVTNDMIDIIVTGVGPVAAAIHTTIALNSTPYNLVINAGIGGGFPDQCSIGSIVVADQIIAADLGAETPDGFLRLDELGFGSAQISVDPALVSRVIHILTASSLPATSGPILTVSTATGTSQTASRMSTQIPSPLAEAMEGFGVAASALEYDVPIIEIRTISNLVGERDTTAWRIHEALDTLTRTFSILLEVLQHENHLFSLS